MIRTLFHGSKSIIKRPVFGYGKTYNDYGRGFYCTEEVDKAMEWAANEDCDGYVNSYSFDDTGMKILNLNDGSYSVLHWITILLINREFQTKTPLSKTAKSYLIDNYSLPYEDYDVITGYRADDSYFSLADDFINGAISVNQLSAALRLGNLGEQYVIKSERAFKKLKRTGYEVAKSGLWLPQRELREKIARRQYREMSNEQYVRGDLYITKIIDEEVQPDDPRLR